MGGSIELGGDEMADLANEIVPNINDKPVDLHSALHSIFDGVCRRAMMVARDEIIDALHEVSQKLPINSEELNEEFTAVEEAAKTTFRDKCSGAGVPEDDPT